LVPKLLGDLVYEAFNVGKRSGRHPTGAWMLAADAAIETVHLATGRRIRQLKRAMDYAILKDGKKEARHFARRVIACADGPVVPLLRAAWDLTE
jgi:hypothetical protein